MADIMNAVVTAFPGRPDIVTGIDTILARLPESSSTITKIIDYVQQLKANASTVTNGTSIAPGSDSSSKKRKLDDANGHAAPPIADSRPVFAVADISFSVPVRKKLRLEGLAGGIRAVDAQGNAEVNLALDSIDHVFCLPIPDRAKPQFSFVVITQSSTSVIEDAAVWTAPEPNPKLPDTAQESHITITEKLDALLGKHGKAVEVPREEDFAGKVGPKDNRTYGVRAHRGTKEGHLFFLQPGILFAFKKPLVFLPFHAIVSVSYTSVLQRTFNLNIVVRETSGSGGGAETETELEFAMIDQESYAGIDEYIKKRGLNDASLADARRAKVYGVNAKKGGARGAAEDGEAAGQENGVGTGADGQEDNEDDGMTELQRAEKLLQDQEDEEEEDYVDDEEDDDGSSEEGYEGEVAAEEVREDAEAEEAEEEEYEEEAGGYEDEDAMEQT